MDYQVIDWQQDGHVATVRLNRPEALNALNGEIRVELADAFARIRDDSSVRVAILTGTGRAFCAGADLKERARTEGDGASGPATVLQGGAQGLFTADLGKPLIAAINGLALGGGLELTLACDIRVAVDTAIFGLPEITRGFFPGGGGPLRLPRLIGRSLAMEMLLTGDPIDSTKAMHCGLVSHVVGADELMPLAMRLARRIAGHAPLAVQANRELAHATDDMTIGQVQRMSQLSRWVVQQTDDAKEGPRAFVEKREPTFRGR